MRVGWNCKLYFVLYKNHNWFGLFSNSRLLSIKIVPQKLQGEAELEIQKVALTLEYAGW